MSITPRTLSYTRPRKVGYRKTDIKVQSRRTPAQMPEMRLVLTLPSNLGFGIPPGPVKGIPSVNMVAGNRAEVLGRNKAYVCEVAAKFIRTIAKGRQGERFEATLWRGDEKVPGQIVVMSGNPAVLIDGLAMRPLFFEN